MGQLTLSRELALRIGLAAKALPDTGPEHLIDALIHLLGLPVTTEKLESVTLSQYRNALRRTCPADSLKKSLAFLQQETTRTTGHATPTPIRFYREGDMPHSIRIAVASQDGSRVDGGFSTCEQFYIYQVSAREYRLIAIRPAVSAKTLKAEQNQHYRAEIIQDCQVMYSRTIGSLASAKVIKQGVHPITLKDAELILNVISQLQQVLLTAPPPWLAKRMGMIKTPATHLLEEETL